MARYWSHGGAPARALERIGCSLFNDAAQKRKIFTLRIGYSDGRIDALSQHENRPSPLPTPADPNSALGGSSSHVVEIL
jgi:hypothetical protein